MGLNLSRRLERIEISEPMRPTKPFLWPAGQSLADALADAGLSLDDEDLFAIELVGPDGCPIHDRDRHLLD